MDSETPERRRSRRYQVPEVHGSLVLSMDAQVLDISFSGMAFETNTRLIPHRTYSFKVGHAASSISLAGTVVWCFLKGTQRAASGEVVPVYRAGIEFDKVLSEKSHELLQFLQAKAVITLETRLFGRFRMEHSQPINLSSEADFQVKTISLSGMLIEADLDAEPEAIYQLTLDLPHGEVQLQARAAYVKRLDSVDTERVEIGLEFLDLDAEKHSALEQFIARELATSAVARSGE